jgi:hypothetical protein
LVPDARTDGRRGAGVTDVAAQRPPRSASLFFANLIALAAGLGAAVLVAVQRDAPWVKSLAYPPIVPCAVTFVLLALIEWRLRRRGRLAPTEFAPTRLRETDYVRVRYRLIGFLATLGLVALAYWLFPEYHGSFYDPYWHLLETLAPLLVFVPFYFIWADARVRDPEDEYVAFGKLLAGRRADVDGAVIRRHLLAWTVKAFFLPLMAVYLHDQVRGLEQLYARGGWAALYHFDGLFNFSYTTDLLFCVIGYLATVRLFDSHIRSVEPTMLGWVVALICYQPFYSVIGQFYLHYDGNVDWSGWLAPTPVLRDLWGMLIVALSIFYGLATAAFGLRFSNLTHRGILTNGPYRLTKHPAYVSKNLSWWLISVPFVVSGDWPTTIRHCALLLLLNTVYFLRARTEEWHLSRDPNYVTYALWMNEHSALRVFGRLIPALRYRAPSRAAR